MFDGKCAMVRTATRRPAAPSRSRPTHRARGKPPCTGLTRDTDPTGRRSGGWAGSRPVSDARHSACALGRRLLLPRAMARRTLGYAPWLMLAGLLVGAAGGFLQFFRAVTCWARLRGTEGDHEARFSGFPAQVGLTSRGQRQSCWPTRSGPWHRPACAAAVAIGAVMSTVNVLLGIPAIEYYARDKSYTTFLKAVLGGMGLRLALHAWHAGGADHDRRDACGGPDRFVCSASTRSTSSSKYSTSRTMSFHAIRDDHSDACRFLLPDLRNAGARHGAADTLHAAHGTAEGNSSPSLIAHVHDAHELELPFLGHVHLPQFPPVQIAGDHDRFSITKHVVFLWVAALLLCRPCHLRRRGRSPHRRVPRASATSWKCSSCSSATRSWFRTWGPAG